MDRNQFIGDSPQYGQVPEAIGITLRVIGSTPPLPESGNALADGSYELLRHEANRTQNLDFTSLMQSVADADPSSQLFREWSEFESLYAALFLSTDSGVASELVSIAEFQGTAANATGPSGPRMTPAPSTYPPASVSTSPQDLANQRDNENPSTVFSNEAFIAYSFLPPDNSITRSNHQHAVTHYSPICSSSTAFPPPVIADGSSHRHCRNTFTPSLHQERNVNMDHDLTLASYPPSAYLAIPLHNRLEGGNRSARRPHLDVGRVRTSEGMAGMDAENLRLTGHFSEDNETSLDGRSKQPGYFADTHSLNTNSSQPSSQEDCSLPTRCSSPSHELPMGGALLSRRLSAPEAEQRRYGGGLFLSCQLDESFGISDVRRTLRPFRSLEYISAPSTLSNGIRHPFTNEFATVSPPEFSHQSNAEPSRSVEVNHGLKPPDSVWTAYRNGGLLAAPTSPAYSTDTPSDYSYGTDSSPMSGTPASVFAGDEFPAASTSHSPYEQSTQEGEGDRIFNNGQENREPRSDVEMTTMQAERRKGKRSRSPRAGSSVAFDVGTDAVGDAAIKRRKYPPKWKCEACQRTFTRKANWDYHMRAHNGEKPFDCTVAGCSKSFGQRQDLKRHRTSVHRGLKHQRIPMLELSFPDITTSPASPITLVAGEQHEPK